MVKTDDGNTSADPINQLTFAMSYNSRFNQIIEEWISALGRLDSQEEIVSRELRWMMK